MGSFYTNLTLKGPGPDEVIKFMNDQKRKTFVSPLVNGCVLVFDEKCEEQDPKVMAAFAGELSRQFKCLAWAVMNHDDDVLYYWLYQNGEKADEYDSTPWFWDESLPREPKGGNAPKLAAAFGAPNQAAKVEAILRKEAQSETGYALATERHTELLQALNLPLLAAGQGYEYLMQGDYQGDFDLASLARTGWE